MANQFSGETFDRLNNDIKESMKSQAKERLLTLRFMKNLLMQNQTSEKPIDELSVLASHLKKLQDSLALYPKESSATTQLQFEIEVTKEYLPKGLEDKDVSKLISEIYASLKNEDGAQAMKLMGSIMKELSPHIKGRFDGKKASTMVGDFLKTKA